MDGAGPSRALGIGSLARGTLALVVLLCALAGCSTGFGPAIRLHAEGRLDAAYETLARVNPRKEDRLLYQMELGKLAQDAGRFEASVAAFREADLMLQDWNARPGVDVGLGFEDAAAFIGDERLRRYRPTPYDQVFVQTAQAINYAMIGEADLAAVKARRQLELQEWVLRERGDLLGTLAEIKAEDSDDARRLSEAEEHPAFLAERDRLGVMTDPRYAADLAPYGYYVGSVLMRAAGYPAEHREFADRLRAFAPGSEAAGLVSGSVGLEPKVYVLFENGVAPAREKLTATVAGADVVPLPQIRVLDGDRASRLRVSAGGLEKRTEPIGSVDQAVVSDFNERLVELWGRPIASTAAKVAATEIAARSVEDEALRLLIRIVGYTFVGAAEADLRTWRSLPGEQQAGEIVAPADGLVRLELVDSFGRVTARLDAEVPVGGPSLLFVRSVNDVNLAAYVAPLGRAGWGSASGSGGRAPSRSRLAGLDRKDGS